VSLPGGAQAVYTSSGLAYYRHKDWLGSSRLASTPTRTTFSDTALAPYGEAYAQSGTTDLNFTGMNQDVASGVYDFPAREYGAVPGRWPSPDPAGLAAVNPGNPQSWNRYAYVQNDPLSLTDPQGLDCEVTVGGTVMGYISGCGGEISSSGGGASGVGWDSAFGCDIGPSSNCGTSGGVGDDDNLLCVTGNTTIPAPLEASR
jgi:RHS repeat-associated protein